MKKKLTTESIPKQSLRIAMIVDAWFPKKNSGKHGVYGGGQVHVNELSKRLHKRYTSQVEIIADPHHHMFTRLLWTFFTPLRIALMHQKKSFDLIHSHGFNAGLVGKITSLLLHVPVVHTVHGSHLMDQGDTSLKGQLERWLLAGIAYSAQITVSSTFLRYQRATKNISIIRNGVEIQAFDAITAKKESSPTIIWVGRRDKVKALDVLQQAFEIVKQSVPDVKLNLVSGGRLSGKSLITAYKQAWVFCLPSYAEGQPITLLEAWAAKLPVVVTRVGENPHMVKHGINGYLVEPGNAQSLAQELLKLLQSPLKAKRLGLNGYAMAKRNYSWDKVVDQTYAVYESLLH
jgi:glycosyltransferase involved in cell wall biosynthesis